MSKKAKVVVSTPTPWKKVGGCYITVGVSVGLSVTAHRPTNKTHWTVDAGTISRLPATATEDDAVKSMKSYLRERLLADLASLHEDEVTGTGPVPVAVQ